MQAEIENIIREEYTKCGKGSTSIAKGTSTKISKRINYLFVLGKVELLDLSVKKVLKEEIY